MPASWRLGASPWTVPGTFGGISYLRDKIASSRPKPIGRWQGSIPFRETTSSFLFPNPPPDESFNVTDHKRCQPVMAGAALHIVERYLCHAAPVDADRR